MKIALAQLTSGIDPAANARILADSAAHAGEGGAAMLFTPEMTGLLDRDRARAADNITTEDDDVTLAAAREAAARHELWIHLGSIALRRPNGRLANRGFVIDDKGAIRARYDKLHLFDVDLPTGESWRESAAYAAGEGAVVVDTPIGALGCSICYDLRFADLYRALSDAGATVLAIPAAFTRPTGAAHWHVLMRARAIESAAFVVAAAQTGTHEDGRATYGHSLVIDPWGEILLDMGEASGIGFAEIDPARIADVRARNPGTRPSPTHSTGGAVQMIVFDLKCGVGHVFEAWFGSSSDYEDQRTRGLLSCPLCGDAAIGKAVMAPNVPAKSNAKADEPPNPAAVKAAMAAIARAQRKALDGSTWVGRSFATKARAMHDGEIDHSPIHGQASADEARALVEDGVPVAPLPFPVLPPESRN